MDQQSDLHYYLMCKLQNMLKATIYTEARQVVMRDGQRGWAIAIGVSDHAFDDKFPRGNTADKPRELALLNMAIALGARPTAYKAWEYDPEYADGPWLPVRVRRGALKERGAAR